MLPGGNDHGLGPCGARQFRSAGLELGDRFEYLPVDEDRKLVERNQAAEISERAGHRIRSIDIRKVTNPARTSPLGKTLPGGIDDEGRNRGLGRRARAREQMRADRPQRDDDADGRIAKGAIEHARDARCGPVAGHRRQQLDLAPSKEAFDFSPEGHDQGCEPGAVLIDDQRDTRGCPLGREGQCQGAREGTMGQQRKGHRLQVGKG